MHVAGVSLLLVAGTFLPVLYRQAAYKCLSIACIQVPFYSMKHYCALMMQDIEDPPVPPGPTILAYHPLSLTFVPTP